MLLDLWILGSSLQQDWKAATVGLSEYLAAIIIAAAYSIQPPPLFSFFVVVVSK
jgi:hypothetical protein